jgi:hypothetical protein
MFQAWRGKEGWGYAHQLVRWLLSIEEHFFGLPSGPSGVFSSPASPRWAGHPFHERAKISPDFSFYFLLFLSAFWWYQAMVLFNPP